METCGNFDTDTFWSAVKRKDILGMLEVVFNETGHTKSAVIANDSTRVTNLAVSKMRDVLGQQVEVEETECCEPTEEVIELDEPCCEPTEEDAPITVADIKLLIKDGSKKSLKAAKKAIKTQFDKSHPNHKELKKLLKSASAS